MAKKSRPVASPPPPPERLMRARWAAAACGTLYFLAVGGYHAIVPGNIDWLMRNDWSQHYLGWAFFRHTPWQWPLGAVPGLGHPVGTSLALTDANPLFALTLRPFAPWLPDPLQYIGPYMAMCMALQGYCGALVGQLLGARARAAFLCGCLFTLTPALLHRMDHDTLMGQWLIVASIALALWRPKASHRRRFMTMVWGVAVLAALIHPYLLAMALPILCISVAQHLTPYGELPRGWAALFAVAVATSLGLIAWALGYLGTRADWGTDGFGFFSADITAWFNPRGWSRVLPSFFAHRGQAYEGFGYLGLGLMLLMALGCATAAHARTFAVHKRRAWALTAVAALSMLFAWSSVVSFGGAALFDLRALYAPIEHVCAMFRASGRFVWVPTYLMMTGAMAAILRHHRPHSIDALLATLVVIQLIDVRPLHVYERLTQDPKVAMVDPLWRDALGDYDHIMLVPPNFPTSHVQCNPRGYREKVEMPPGMLAASLGMTVNSAYLSRSDARAIASYCDAFGHQLERGVTDRRSIYLVHPDYLPMVTEHGAPMVCFRADGYIGCVRKDGNTKLIKSVLAQARQMGP